MKRSTPLSAPARHADGTPASLPARRTPAHAEGKPALGSEELIAQLKRWVTLLRALEQSLVQSRDVILRLDSNNILKAAVEQQSLCLELRCAQNALITAGGAVVAEGSVPTLIVQLSPADVPAAGVLRQELSEAERKVRYAARLNSALLQRSSRTATALRNLYLSCLGTYANPAATASANWRL